MTSVHQKVALVTGGARRIGRAIALGLAKAGWDIAVHYGNSENDAETTAAAVRALGRRAVVLQCDLLDTEATVALLPMAQVALGPVSCVVNNASIFEFDDTKSFSVPLLQRHMLINLSAPILLAQALHAATPAGSQSVVVNLLDQKLFNLNPDFLSYTLSKAALHCASTMLAQALAPTVRVVNIAPGLTLPSHMQTDGEFHDTHQLSPLGASNNPEEIADGVIFAVTNRAITGSTILIDSGQHMLSLPRDFSFIKRN